MTIEDLKHFRQLGSKTAGHPEYGHATGIETTTGPLGQGIANAVGMAIAERKLREEFGADLDHHTYVHLRRRLPDGRHQPRSHRARRPPEAQQADPVLGRQHITIDGAVSLSDSTDQIARFKAVHWNTIDVDGHDPDAIAAAIEAAQKSDRPTFIACKTIIGFGAPNKQGTHKVHGYAARRRGNRAARKALNWEAEAFVIPADVLDAWRAAGAPLRRRAQGLGRPPRQGPARRPSSTRRLAGELPAGLDAAIARYKKKLAETKPTVATRKASEDALEVINGFLPETLGGSADLTPSNNTKTSQMQSITPTDFAGRYMHWGIREHGMAAAMNGIALHGGLIPYGGGFMIFSDYCRPPIRLAALMGIRVIHVLTHEFDRRRRRRPDAPAGRAARRPARHPEPAGLPSGRRRRKRRNAGRSPSRRTTVRRPGADAPEPERRRAPNTAKRTFATTGAYELAGNADAKVTIFASGSEVETRRRSAAAALKAKGIAARVVSVPCIELFFEQPEAYRKAIIGNSPVKIAVEAAVREGWDAFIGPEGAFVGMKSFGASGPAKERLQAFRHHRRRRRRGRGSEACLSAPEALSNAHPALTSGPIDRE